jgi:hypothetical protein
VAQEQSSMGNRREAERNVARNLATAQFEQKQQSYNNAPPTVRPGSDVATNKSIPTKKTGYDEENRLMYRDKSSMGNRLAPQKGKVDDEEAKRKARERALMNRLSSKPGKASS